MNTEQYTLRTNCNNKPDTTKLLSMLSDINTEIRNLDIEVFVEKQIFWLQVSMHNHMPMTVVNAGNNLLEKPSRSRLLQL